MKSLLVVTIFLGLTATLVGIIGFAQNNDKLLPVAFGLFVSTIIVYGISLIKGKKKDNKG